MRETYGVRKIFREVIPVDDQWHALTLRGEVLHVATRVEGAVEFWHLCDYDAPAVTRTFIVVPTGRVLMPAARWVGSAITPSGRLVWHLMEGES